MSEHTWTEDAGRRRWTLDAAPRYAVERRGPGRYAMLIDGFEVDAHETVELACMALEARYEYEAHAADLEEARLRLRQLGDRLRERFPRVARDGEVASLYNWLSDALGRGPEAEDDAKREPDVFRRQLSPDLAAVLDASQCIVLEVTTPAGRVLRRVTVPDVAAHTSALDDARTAQQVSVEENSAARLRGADEKRRAEGKLTKSEAVEWLVAKGPFGRMRSVAIAGQLRDDGGSVLGMTYADGYWVIPSDQD